MQGGEPLFLNFACQCILPEVFVAYRLFGFVKQILDNLHLCRSTFEDSH